MFRCVKGEIAWGLRDCPEKRIMRLGGSITTRMSQDEGIISLLSGAQPLGKPEKATENIEILQAVKEEKGNLQAEMDFRKRARENPKEAWQKQIDETEEILKDTLLEAERLHTERDEAKAHMERGEPYPLPEREPVIMFRGYTIRVKPEEIIDAQSILNELLR